MLRPQSLREVYRVTEYRDGAVFRTESIARVWIWIDVPESPPEGLFYGSVPTSYTGSTVRSVIVPDGSGPPLKVYTDEEREWARAVMKQADDA